MNLHTENLSVGYGKKVVVDQVELTLQPGQIVTLIGPNGAGKSTILKTITRQLDPVKGVVYLGEKQLSTWQEKEIAKELSVVMTHPVSPELMTCREVVSMGRYPYTGRMGNLTAQDNEQVEKALALVHGEDTADCWFHELSDGQKQRAMLARAICQQTEIMVLDEPTSYLDMRFKLDILKVIRILAVEEKKAILMSLHELDLAQKISDLIICVDGNKISDIGTPEEIFTGNRIQKLYKIDEDCFDPETGAMFLSKEEKSPEVFVIGGGGAALPLYRKLSRKQIPFVAGILSENDVEYRVAKAGAQQVVAAKAFFPLGQEKLEEAKALLDSCKWCVGKVRDFGPGNMENQVLLAYAKEKNKLISEEELWQR